MSTELASVKKEFNDSNVKSAKYSLIGMIWGHKAFSFGAFMIMGFAVIAIIGPWIIPYSPYTTDYSIALHAPSLSHLFGTDNLGRDVLSRVMIGSREALGSGVLIVGLALLIGIPLGLAAGYFGGWVDEVIMRLVDTGLSLPGLVLAMAISFSLGPSFINSVMAVAVIMAPQFIRIVRGQVLSLRDREYIQAARTQGVPAWRIMVNHILRNSSTPIIVASNLNIGYAIMTVASLSFLGLSTPPPFPSWGEMMQSGTQFLTISPWISFFPGMCIFLLVLAFTILGEGIRDILDPQSKG